MRSLPEVPRPSAAYRLPEPQITQLDSGMRVATQAMPYLHSVMVEYWIGTGSANETDKEAGLSHLVEHMLFKGSERFSPGEVDRIIEGMGGEINAETSEQATALSAHVSHSCLPDALDVMSDIVWHPVFRELDAERGVILDEIARSEDDPGENTLNLLSAAIFGKHPLGRPVYGRTEIVEEASLKQIRAFHSTHYVPANTAVVAAGAVDHDQLVALISAQAPEQRTPPPAAFPAPTTLQPQINFQHYEGQQYHVCIGGPGLSQTDERRFALWLLDAILGGNASSRLFAEMRERKALAYEVSSFAVPYVNCGQLGVYVATMQGKLALALETISTELERLRHEPPSTEELEHAKGYLKGRTQLSRESPEDWTRLLASSIFTRLPLCPIEEVVARIDAVSRDDLAALADDLFAPGRLSIVGVGSDEATFRAAAKRCFAE